MQFVTEPRDLVAVSVAFGAPCSCIVIVRQLTLGLGMLVGVNLTGIDAVRPAEEIDPGYAAALREAVASGVEVLAYGVSLTPEAIVVDRRLDVLL